MATPYDSLDSMDFGRLITSGDCTVYGMIEVEDYMETTSIAEAVIENLEAGLLASDFNLKETRLGGFIVVGNKEVMSKLPAVNISYASHMISSICNSPQLVSGVYEVADQDNTIKVFTMFSGLGLPTVRVNNLQREAEEQMAIAKEKENTRSEKMSIDYGTTTETKAQEVHKIITQKKSGFGKLTTNANKKIIDYRKRKG
jgi:hypothetical protein